MEDAIREIIETGQKIYHQGFVVATEGNLSVRIDQNTILATSSGVCKGELTPEDLVLLNLDGEILKNGKAPSSEIKMHLEVYRTRPEVNAVLHAHPPYAVSLTLVGISLDKPFLPESAILLGSVPTAPYGRPSTEQVAQSIQPFIKKTDTILLDRHGSLTVGKTMKEAYYKLEILEHTAHIIWLARQIKHFLPLDTFEIRELLKLRESTYGLDFPILPFG